MASSSSPPKTRSRLVQFLSSNPTTDAVDEHGRSHPPKWAMGVLNDPDTVEVPGSVLLLAAHRNEPLGLRNVHARTSHSSIPAGFVVEGPPTPGGTHPQHPLSPSSAHQVASRGAPASAPAPPPADEEEEKKKTPDGAIILDPQPEESGNDPLNWPGWRRDSALLSLGFYCMLGGGITPLIAAGFTDVSEDFDVDVETVALTTGLYMMGLGLGSVIFSPTAILYGKRPVYLGSALLFIGTTIWAARAQSFESLLAARVFQGVALSPVECLPSATIAEIFFLHERAYRIGIYTLLLLGGKNLVPLVSAAIIGAYGWRWTFWIVAMVGGFGLLLLFLFVPETFWDRTPHRKPHKRPSFLRRLSSRHSQSRQKLPMASGAIDKHDFATTSSPGIPQSPGTPGRHKNLHVGFAPGPDDEPSHDERPDAAHPSSPPSIRTPSVVRDPHGSTAPRASEGDVSEKQQQPPPSGAATTADPRVSFSSAGPAHPDMHTLHSPMTPRSIVEGAHNNDGYFGNAYALDPEKIPASQLTAPPKIQAYTHNLRQQPAKSFAQQLKVYHGRLNNDKFFKVMLRPFVLFAYPAVLWSSAIYACSIGWLIVISESLAILYRDPELYNFTALQTGLTYISPFVGGILGTGVAGKVSDVIVRAMARRNGGLYEPEFRLVMVIPILITTCIGLMGFGWSAEEKNPWIVPTVFFGIISFGCSLGSTTSITYCVDSYRQYAGEALVTLNFAKNILHGLVFSLFVTHWLHDDGPKRVFIWIGVIQLILCLLTIPMYIYGKRARMWTTRKNLMEKF